jgi:hypothetical protein
MTVNSMKQKSQDFYPNYVQEYPFSSHFRWQYTDLTVTTDGTRWGARAWGYELRRDQRWNLFSLTKDSSILLHAIHNLFY